MNFGWGLYKDKGTRSIGTYFGVGQLDFRRWIVSLNWGSRQVNGHHYPKHWWAIGKEARNGN